MHKLGALIGVILSSSLIVTGCSGIEDLSATSTETESSENIVDTESTEKVETSESDDVVEAYATGQAFVSSVRFVFNGIKDTRLEFGALSSARNELKEKDYDAEILYANPNDYGDWKKQLETVAKYEYNDFIVAGSPQFQGLIKEVADKYPDEHFVTWDSYVTGKNISQIIFENEKAMFLAGIVAAHSTVDKEIFPEVEGREKKVVGVIAGYEGIDSQLFIDPFVSGVHAIDKDIEIRTVFLGDLDDKDKAEKEAKKLYDEGAQIIFAPLGSALEGVLDAAEEKERYIIALSTDVEPRLEPEVLLSVSRPIRDTVVEYFTSNVRPEDVPVVFVPYDDDGVTVNLKPGASRLLQAAIDNQEEAWDKAE